MELTNGAVVYNVGGVVEVKISTLGDGDTAGGSKIIFDCGKFGQPAEASLAPVGSEPEV